MTDVWQHRDPTIVKVLGTCVKVLDQPKTHPNTGTPPHPSCLDELCELQWHLLPHGIVDHKLTRSNKELFLGSQKDNPSGGVGTMTQLANIPPLSISIQYGLYPNGSTSIQLPGWLPVAWERSGGQLTFMGSYTHVRDPKKLLVPSFGSAQLHPLQSLVE